MKQKDPSDLCVRKSVSLPPDVIDAVRRAAEQEDRSFSYVVSRAIRRDLDRAAAARKRKRGRA
ncbi:MAG: ribbon-helix-helix protein, CopG family [Opitutales bacterium]|nr:ribbon-helix-helix protein, CopG family [Opitutales bacterium]